MEIRDKYEILKNKKAIIKFASLSTMFKRNNLYSEYEVIGEKDNFEGNTFFFVRKNKSNEEVFSKRAKRDTFHFKINKAIEKELELKFNGCLYVKFITNNSESVYLSANYFRFFENSFDKATYIKEDNFVLFYEGNLLVGGLCVLTTNDEEKEFVENEIRDLDIPYLKYLEFEEEGKQNKSFLMESYLTHLESDLIPKCKDILLKNYNKQDVNKTLFKVEKDSLQILNNGKWIDFITKDTLRKESVFDLEVNKMIKNMSSFKKIFKFILKTLLNLVDNK